MTGIFQRIVVTDPESGKQLMDIPSEDIFSFESPLSPIQFNDITTIKRAHHIRHKTSWYDKHLKALRHNGRNASDYYQLLIYGVFVKSLEGYGGVASSKTNQARQRFDKCWSEIMASTKHPRLDTLYMWKVIGDDRLGFNLLLDTIVPFEVKTADEFLSLIDTMSYLKARLAVHSSWRTERYFSFLSPSYASIEDINNFTEYFIRALYPPTLKMNIERTIIQSTLSMT